MKRLLSFIALLAIATGTANGQCVQRQFGYESFVCVCNSTYCDTYQDVFPPLPGDFYLITSTRDEKRFEYTSGSVSDAEDPTSEGRVAIDTTTLYQSMHGFGGAFTDATGLNINTLSPEAQDNVIKAYFDPNGIGYSVCRIPIAGSDCSTRPYSYDDVEGDVALEFWALAPEDYDYKFPHIKRAIELSAREIWFFGSPWAPPAWMKTNGMFNGTGELLPEMWQPWSEYFVKFVEAYEAEGIPIWGLTPQNEPQTGYLEWEWNTCGWTDESMRDWIKTNLGPTLEAAGMRRLKMMVNDFNRDWLPRYVEPMLADPDSSKYIDGVAVHWYEDTGTGPSVLNETHDLDPSKFLLYTEACEGWDVSGSDSVKLGSWSRGEHYLENIIEDINHWSTGWVDWNMALDMEGAPNWANNLLDAPIIINKDADEFYKQPTFFAMAHAAKFIERGSSRLGTYSSIEQVKATSVLNTDNIATVLLLNMLDAPTTVSVTFDGGVKNVNLELPAKSMQTVVVNLN